MEKDARQLNLNKFLTNKYKEQEIKSSIYLQPPVVDQFVDKLSKRTEYTRHEQRNAMMVNSREQAASAALSGMTSSPMKPDNAYKDVEISIVDAMRD